MRNRKSAGRSALKAVSCAAVLAFAGTQAAQATVFNETEPNDNKAGANAVGPMVAGDSIVGTSTGTSTTVAGPASADNFLISLPASAPGIYRQRLQLTSNTLFQTGTLRGLTVTAAPADTLPGTPWDGVVGTPNAGTDAAIQTSSTTSVPPRYNQFYTFGRPTQMYYRVTGTSSTTADYTATLTTTPVVPTPIGVYAPGQISISTFNQGHTTDTDFWVYDGNLNPIVGSGNDDESPLGGTPGTGATLQGWLARNYAPGTYYIAMTGFQGQSNLASPSDDDFRTGAVTDFADVFVGGGTVLGANMTFTISDGTTTLQVPNTRLDALDVNWFSFTVVPEPATIGLLAMAAPLMLRRRK
jgi:hypothetical protein